MNKEMERSNVMENLKEFEKGFEMRKLVLETALATDKELRSLAVAYESHSQEMEAGK